MTGLFTLPLRPLLEKNDDPDSLPSEIAQINTQWGSFRDVNEEILARKISEEKSRGAALEEKEGVQPVVEADTTERLQELYKRRAEITEFAMKAHMETMFALDFVSLLLSKHAPRQAETSMSAFLKQAAPIGSLNAEVVHPPVKPESAKNDVATVSRGWRIQNFNAAANKLLNAASRLEMEVALESRYWNEVLAVKDKGWKICRLPRERQALAVQYGFIEAAPAFRDRGLASLRRAEEGGLILDKGLAPPKERIVRVIVEQTGRIAGCSKLPAPVSHNAPPIEQRISQARDTVFEEELFHELVREARAMAKCGVTTRQNLIRVPVSDSLEILLDLVDSGEDHVERDQDSSHKHDLMADGLAHLIRILLAYAHRQNLRRRTQFPPPLTLKKHPVPEYHLLRPAVAYLQHMSHVRWLESFLADIFAVLRSAGFDSLGYTADLAATWSLISASGSALTVEAFVERFLAPLESTFAVKLSTPQSSLTVTIRTNLSLLPLGTNFDVSFKTPTYVDFKAPGRVGLKDEVEAAVTHLLMLEVIYTISSEDRSAKKPKSNQDTNEKPSWKVAYPHLGELLLSSSNPEKHKKMKVTLSRHELALKTYTVRNIDGVGRGRWELRLHNSQSHRWKSTTSSDQTSLMDFVATEAQNDRSSAQRQYQPIAARLTLSYPLSFSVARSLLSCELIDLFWDDLLSLFLHILNQGSGMGWGVLKDESEMPWWWDFSPNGSPSLLS